MRNEKFQDRDITIYSVNQDPKEGKKVGAYLFMSHLYMKAIFKMETVKKQVLFKWFIILQDSKA